MKASTIRGIAALLGAGQMRNDDESIGRREDEDEKQRANEEIENARVEKAKCEALTLNDYQRLAISTAIYPGRGNLIGRAYVGLKLNGEAGEVAEHIGKSMRDDAGEITEDRRAKMLAEIGDVLWYVAALASELNSDLATIARGNLTKLQDRKARGVLGGSGSAR